jgi:hypothetical protein
MERNGSLVHPPIYGNIALTSLTINPGDELQMLTSGATFGSYALVSLYINDVFYNDWAAYDSDVFTGIITAEAGNTYRFEFSGPT